MVEKPVAQVQPSVQMSNEPPRPGPADMTLERGMASTAGPQDPRLQDEEITNLHNTIPNQEEPSPSQPAPPPTSPSYWGIEEEEEDQWVKSHPGWSDGHPLMYEAKVRTMSFGPWSYLRKPIDILCCLPPPARRTPFREPWSAANVRAVKSKSVTFESLAMKHLATNMLEYIAGDDVLNNLDRKIGGSLKWEEMADLIFCETDESNKELRGMMKDEKSTVNTVATLLWSAENLAEVMIFAINVRNRMIGGKPMQMIMIAIMQAIKYTCYKKRIEIMKPGLNYIGTSSGVKTMLVANELVYSLAEYRPAKLINDSKGNAYSLHPYTLTFARNETNLIEFRATTTPSCEIALANDYDFHGLVHVNNDGILTVNTDSLDRVNGATNILYGMGHVLVIPVKPGFVDRQPRKRKLTLMLFNLFNVVVGCFIPRSDAEQFRQEFRDSQTDIPNMRPIYARRLLSRLPIFHGAQKSMDIKPLDNLYTPRDLLEPKKNRKRTWEQSVFTKKSE